MSALCAWVNGPFVFRDSLLPETSVSIFVRPASWKNGRICLAKAPSSTANALSELTGGYEGETFRIRSQRTSKTVSTRSQNSDGLLPADRKSRDSFESLFTLILSYILGQRQNYQRSLVQRAAHRLVNATSVQEVRRRSFINS